MVRYSKSIRDNLRTLSQKSRFYFHSMKSESNSIEKPKRGFDSQNNLTQLLEIENAILSYYFDLKIKNNIQATEFLQIKDPKTRTDFIKLRKALEELNSLTKESIDLENFFKLKTKFHKYFDDYNEFFLNFLQEVREQNENGELLQFEILSFYNDFRKLIDLYFDSSFVNFDVSIFINRLLSILTDLHIQELAKICMSHLPLCFHSKATQRWMEKPKILTFSNIKSLIDAENSFEEYSDHFLPESEVKKNNDLCDLFLDIYVHEELTTENSDFSLLLNQIREYENQSKNTDFLRFEFLVKNLMSIYQIFLQFSEVIQISSVIESYKMIYEFEKLIVFLKTNYDTQNPVSSNLERLQNAKMENKHPLLNKFVTNFKLNLKRTLQSMQLLNNIQHKSSLIEKENIDGKLNFTLINTLQYMQIFKIPLNLNSFSKLKLIIWKINNMENSIAKYIFNLCLTNPILKGSKVDLFNCVLKSQGNCIDISEIDKMICIFDNYFFEKFYISHSIDDIIWYIEIINNFLNDRQVSIRQKESLFIYVIELLMVFDRKLKHSNINLQKVLVTNLQKTCHLILKKNYPKFFSRSIINYIFVLLNLDYIQKNQFLYLFEFWVNDPSFCFWNKAYITMSLFQNEDIKFFVNSEKAVNIIYSKYQNLITSIPKQISKDSSMSFMLDCIKKYRFYVQHQYHKLNNVFIFNIFSGFSSSKSENLEFLTNFEKFIKLFFFMYEDDLYFQTMINIRFFNYFDCMISDLEDNPTQVDSEVFGGVLNLLHTYLISYFISELGFSKMVFNFRIIKLIANNLDLLSFENLEVAFKIYSLFYKFKMENFEPNSLDFTYFENISDFENFHNKFYKIESEMQIDNFLIFENIRIRVDQLDNQRFFEIFNVLSLDYFEETLPFNQNEAWLSMLAQRLPAISSGDLNLDIIQSVLTFLIKCHLSSIPSSLDTFREFLKLVVQVIDLKQILENQFDIYDPPVKKNLEQIMLSLKLYKLNVSGDSLAHALLMRMEKIEINPKYEIPDFIFTDYYYFNKEHFPNNMVVNFYYTVGKLSFFADFENSILFTTDSLCLHLFNTKILRGRIDELFPEYTIKQLQKS